jgi:hypothetical protein
VFMRIGACFVAKVNGYLDVDDTSPVFYPYFFVLLLFLSVINHPFDLFTSCLVK